MKTVYCIKCGKEQQTEEQEVYTCDACGAVQMVPKHPRKKKKAVVDTTNMPSSETMQWVLRRDGTRGRHNNV